MNNSTLHAVIISSFLETQRPPTVSEIAARFGCDEDTVRQGLQELAEYHGVVLHPHDDSIWVAHPFSAAPTTCVVHAGKKRWWGNCAWCSLGVVQLAGGTATIETRLGAIGDPVSIRIEHGTVLDKNYVVHFPVPMRQAWDNVIYTCSVMLIFESDAQVDEWCTSRGIPKGDVRPLQQIWNFAKDWYGNHASPTWTKWTVPKALALFKRHHLTGPIWELEERTERF